MFPGHDEHSCFQSGKKNLKNKMNDNLKPKKTTTSVLNIRLLTFFVAFLQIFNKSINQRVKSKLRHIFKNGESIISFQPSNDHCTVLSERQRVAGEVPRWTTLAIIDFGCIQSLFGFGV
jgi:hypothetical protein